jgi:hypothetical protein
MKALSEAISILNYDNSIVFNSKYKNISNSELIDICIPCISDEEWIIKQYLE